jgi:O-antigen/teichoic acid export membrane protein
MSELEYTVEKAGVHAFLYTLSTIIKLIILVATLMVTARFLGPVNYGLYGLAQIPMSVLILFTDLGLDAAVLRYSSLYASRGRMCMVSELARTALAAKLLLSFLVSAPLVLLGEELGVVFSSRSGIGLYVALTALTLAPQVLVGNLSSLMVGLGEAWSWTIVGIAQPAVRLLAVVALFKLVAPSIENTIIATGLSYITALIIALLLVRKVISMDGCGLDFKEVLTYALAVYSGSVAGAIVGRLQSYILGFVTADLGDLGNAMAGYFNAAYNFLGAVTAVYGAIATPLLPLFVYQSKSGEGDLGGVAEAALSALLALTLPLSLFSIVYSGDVIRAVYGSEYVSASFYYTIISLTLLTWPFTVVTGSIIQAGGYKEVILKSNIIGLAAGVTLYTSLGLLFGVPGLAIAYAAAGAPALVYQLLFLSKRGFEFGYSKYAKMFAASAMAVASSIPLAVLLPLSIARLTVGFLITLLAYSVASAGLHALTDIELSFLGRVSRSIPVVGEVVSAYLGLYKKIQNYFARRY